MVEKKNKFLERKSLEEAGILECLGIDEMRWVGIGKLEKGKNFFVASVFGILYKISSS